MGYRTRRSLVERGFAFVGHVWRLERELIGAIKVVRDCFRALLISYRRARLDIDLGLGIQVLSCEPCRKWFGSFLVLKTRC